MIDIPSVEMVDVKLLKRDGNNPNVMKKTEKKALALRNSTLQGAVVLDSFGGSGCTLIACEQMKRKARIMEFEPVYCDVMIKRWENLTGRKAEKL